MTERWGRVHECPVCGEIRLMSPKERSLPNGHYLDELMNERRGIDDDELVEESEEIDEEEELDDGDWCQSSSQIC